MNNPSHQPIRVLHVTPGLGLGGAELMLERLLSSGTSRGIESAVLNLGPESGIADRIASSGVPVWSAYADQWRGAARLPAVVRKAVRAWQPDVFQGWMYHGNLAATLLSSSVGRQRPVVWTIRQSLYDVSKEKPGTQIVIWAGRALSGTPALTIYNSREAADSHSRLGFSARRQLVIPNGFDCGRFVPNFAARNRIRQELAIPEDHLVIGHVARYHPVKGHQLLIDAIASLAEVALPMTFLLIGSGVDANNVELAAALRRTGIGSRVKLLGPRTDMPNLTAAFDLAVLSSEAESFPNVVAEAMACGIPVIATHVGDCADIIGDSGVVCPVGDAIALSSGIKLLAGRSADERREMGKRARARIEARYSLDSVAQRYWEVYSSVSTVPRKQLATLSLN